MSVETPEDFTPLHFLASVYIAFAHCTDGDLSEEEKSAILHKIHEWDSDANPTEIEKTCDDAFDWLSDMGPDDFDTTISNLVGWLTTEDGPFKDNLQAIVNDLVQISMADGQIHPNEESFVRAFAKDANATVPSKFQATT
jgi:hypothetical protein